MRPPRVGVDVERALGRAVRLEHPQVLAVERVVGVRLGEAALAGLQDLLQTGIDLRRRLALGVLDVDVEVEQHRLLLQHDGARVALGAQDVRGHSVAPSMQLVAADVGIAVGRQTKVRGYIRRARVVSGILQQAVGDASVAIDHAAVDRAVRQEAELARHHSSNSPRTTHHDG